MANSRVDKEKAFLKAFEDYSDALYRHCLFRVNDHETAVDLTQDIFLRAWRKAVSHDEEVHNWKAYLYRVARTRVIDTYRSASRNRDQSLDVLIEAGFDWSSVDTDYPEYEHTLRALDALDPSDREIIIMRYIDDLSPPEIADVLGVKVNTASVRINRAIKKLKKRLQV